MICGEGPDYSIDFPYRSGSALTGFFTGLDFDYVHGGSRLPWTVDTLQKINSTSHDTAVGISDDMVRIVRELLNPTYFEVSGNHPRALQRVSTLLHQYSLEVVGDKRGNIHLRELSDDQHHAPTGVTSSQATFQSATPIVSPPLENPSGPPTSQSQRQIDPSQTGDTSGYSSSLGLTSESYDVAIICALHAELGKVLETGTESWQRLASDKQDPNTYHRTTFFTRNNTALRVIAGAAVQMGMPASAVLATKMILRFRPKLVIMVGIAAGSRIKAQGYGDILAPDQTFDFGAGRLEVRDGKPYLVPDPNPLAIHPRLRDRLRHWSQSRVRLDEIANSWPAERPRTSLQLHVGPLASSAAVLNTTTPLLETMEHWRKLVGVEMEAYATHFACHNAVDPSTAFLCAKSISDFAEQKEDRWQSYARFTAAQFVFKFLTDEWDELHLSR